jgi:uncharacterized membrane protein
MKFLLISFAICSMVACKSTSGNRTPAHETATKDTPGNTTPIVASENPVPFFIASGFEPMWNLELSIAQDGTYPVTFTTVTGKMTGTLRIVTENNFEGIVKGEGKESLLKVVITNTPCMREDGETKDPQTAIITYKKNTFSGCGRKQVTG